jgi:hypothetical protein
MHDEFFRLLYDDGAAITAVATSAAAVAALAAAVATSPAIAIAIDFAFTDFFSYDSISNLISN